MKKTVNALGDICPIPLVKAKEAIKELQAPEPWRCWSTMRSLCRT